MKRSRCIRIFHTKQAAQRAKMILELGGIEAKVREDGFGTLTLTDLGIRPRFRLYISQEDIEPAAELLRKKLSEKSLEE